MAKENTVNLHGQIQASPKVYIKDGVPLRGAILLKTLRRPVGAGGVMGSKLYFDCPIILTRNPEMIKQMYEFKKGDMIDVKGALTTKEVDKSSLCTHCKGKNISKGNSVFITPYYLCKRESELSMDEGLRLLKERCEVSNTIAVIGTLCRDPEYYKDERNRDYAQYQLACNRKYRIKEDDPSVKTDYPWIKTFGSQALKDSEGLRTGSVIYINGALQTRDITRKSVCSHCGEEYEWNESVLEIVPYSTEYLSGCIVPMKEDEDGEIETEG